jgi:hypothetical protein
MEPLIAFLALTGWVLGTVRVCRYMIDNPPRYEGGNE